ncbi:reprolysin-like metallopeptidase [Lysobacter sp. cf310]|uniref:reprolysin-like metallopeptidase n=1 Tax=Lysobacter sp. cf310 TaxID=1761790 RepID=UPI0008E7FDB3|nr:FG-GAP-like repeat-containing protein [Lysobacter sp. cf310]SFK45033.1 Repeat domain-containing protein [Lysobacter sp. cf310]
MRHLALSLAAGLLLAGCTSESDVDPSRTRISTAPAAAMPAPARIARASGAGFAALPDRGALARYDRLVAPEVRGAFTSHRIELSEAHALNATTPGSAISLAAPDGRTIRIAYQRHEEHPDGNWTWIGQTEDGLQTVITFGEKAVFGRIERNATEALRIDTLNGRSWLVQVDPAKVLGGQLLSSAASDALAVPATAMAASGSQATPLATPGNTVDLALGYTPGLVTRYGGTSQVNTRLAHLVALTNLAYRSSIVYGRIRLVHTQLVNYTDSTSNPTALAALTGYTCGSVSCETQPVPSELQPLRDARETYGADLVSLVRPFVAPQQTSCGTAWINRPPMDGLPLDATAEKFGYSTISDGSDFNESDGGSYSCREETLAHELGHNLGQAHNWEDSVGQPGAHQYAYGYREEEADGFYTIMAYPLSGARQFSVPYFSNPKINHPGTGRPLGDSNHDNAQSLNWIFRDVAAFRSALVPQLRKSVRNDFNGDGSSDLIWYNTSQSMMAYWWIASTTVVGSGSFFIGPGYRIAGTGDFDGDGRSDILWISDADNTAYLWKSRGDGQFDTAYVSAPYASFASSGKGWTVLSSAYDLNEDGTDDIIWQDSTKRVRYYWMMSGPRVIKAYALRESLIYNHQMFTGGDFDGDRNGDLILVDTTSNQLILSKNTLGDGITSSGLSIGRYDPNWKLAGVADLNGDGRSDLVWQHSSSGLMAYWWMNGGGIQASGVKAIDPAYRIVATGDYNGDGLGDILWTNATTGLIFLWLSRGDGEFDTPFLAAYSPAWAPIP